MLRDEVAATWDSRGEFDAKSDVPVTAIWLKTF